MRGLGKETFVHEVHERRERLAFVICKSLVYGYLNWPGEFLHCYMVEARISRTSDGNFPPATKAMESFRLQEYDSCDFLFSIL